MHLVFSVLEYDIELVDTLIETALLTVGQTVHGNWCAFTDTNAS